MPLVIVDLPFSKGRFNATHPVACQLANKVQQRTKSVAAPVIPSHSM